MAKNDMNFYATLEEAIDAAREVFLADNPDLESDDASVQQLKHPKIRATGWRHYVASRILC